MGNKYKMYQQSFSLFFLLFCFFMIPISCNTQKNVPQKMNQSNKYPTLWKNYEQHINKGENRDALATLDSIFSIASMDKNDPQILKSFFKRNFTSNFQEDALEKQIHYIEKNKSALISETGDAICSSYLGELYQSYLQQHSYKLRNSTNIESETYPYSISDFSLVQLINRSNEYISTSLISEESRKVGLDTYDVIISKLDANGKAYRNTIYDLLVDRAITHFSTRNNYIPESTNEFNFYQEEAFAQSKSFINYDFEKEGNLSSIKKVILIFQKLEEENQNNKEKLLNIELARLTFSYQNSVNSDKIKLYKNSLIRLFERNQKSEQISYIASKLIQHLINQANSKLGNSKEKNPYFIEANEYINKIKKLELSGKEVKHINSLQDQIMANVLQVTTEKVYPRDIDFPINIIFRNLEGVKASLYKLTNEELIVYYENQRRNDVSGSKIKSFEINLPNTDDFDQHSYEYVMEDLEPASYILELKANGKNIRCISFFHVSNIAAVAVDASLQIMDRLTGKPLQANVGLYKRSWMRSKTQLELITTKQSDSEGLVKIGENNDSYLCHITSDNDELFLNDNFYYRSYKPRGRDMYFLNFTDRAIYRSGQSIFYKSILYNNNSNEVLANKEVYVELLNANYQVQESTTLRTNEFGSISGEFILPKDILNGNFTLSFSNKTNKINSSKNIRVEEYKRPTYKIEFEELTETYSFDKEISSIGKAISYNQVPLSDQKVSYAIERNQIYRWYYFSRYYTPMPAKIIANGEVETDKEGKFEIKFIPEKPKTINPYNNFSYTIKVKLTDEKGETRTALTTIYVSDKDFVIHTNKQKYGSSDDKVEIVLKNQSNKIINDEVKVQLYKLDEPTQFFIDKKWESEFKSVSKKEYYNRTIYYPFGEENKIENLAISAELDNKMAKVDSSYEYDISSLKNGLYKMILSSSKADTATIYIEKNSKSSVGKEILSIDAKNKVNIDEIINVTLNSIGDLHIYSAESRQDYKFRYKTFFMSNPYSLNYNLTKLDEGGIKLEYFTYYKNRFQKVIKYIQVIDPAKSLQLNWETFRSDLYPGSEEKWRLKIVNNKNEVVATEFVASMYDKSLDAFMAENWGTFSISQKIKNVNISPFATGTTYGRTINKEQGSYGELKAIEYPYINSELSYYLYGYHGYNFFAEGAVLDEVQVVSAGRPVQKRMRNAKVADMAAPASAEPAMEEMEIDMDSNALTDNDDSSILEDNTKETDQSFIRTNLNETVFFKPDLITNESGEIFLEFTMNEALTEWKFLGFGHTQKLQSVNNTENVITKKDLMVFPNGPRFFRTGDEITIPAKIRNMTSEVMKGKASIQFFDLITNEDITNKLGITSPSQSVEIKGESDVKVEWTIKVPEGIESLRYQIVAITDKFKDGEEQTGLVLENRKLVTESKIYVIDQNASETLEGGIKTSETISPKNYTISVVSNPSWLAVQSLPYLMEYRYKCTEQIFSRYFSNALAKNILDVNPEIEKVYNDWNANNQLTSAFSRNVDLKYALLEQSPWVRDAMSEEEQMENLANLFDREKVQAELNANREIILSRSNGGGLPWFPGGRPNAYITQYVLQGFGQLRKLDILENDLKLESFYKDGLRFVEADINKRERRLKKKDYLSPIDIHFLYTKSFFPELSLKAETKLNVNRWEKIAKDKWLDYSLLNKAQLAIYFYRSGDEAFAKTILENLRQRSLYKRDLGRYWKETNGYYWYQSNLEAQSLLMSAFKEIEKDTEIVEELKQWLLSNKQTNRWNSTKSTTQAIYAIIETGTNNLANQKLVEIKGIDQNNVQQSPIKKAVGEYNIRYLEEQILTVPRNIEVVNPNPNKAWVSTTYQYIDDLDKIDNYQETPIKVKRELFVKERSDSGDFLIPLKDNTAKVGDEIVIKLTLEVDRPMEFIHIQDSRASGTEPKNVYSKYKYENGLYYYEETKDEATNFFIDNLPRGTYNFEYEVYAVQKGDFSAGLAIIQSMYAPEFNAHSSGIRIKIIE